MAVRRAPATRAVGRYQLVHELGQSYLGPLWAVRVEGADSSEPLAMLRLVSLARLDADTRVRLLEAAWQAMEVRDDRVCSVTDVVASDGELGVVSDYVEGVTLRGLSSFASVRRKPAPPPVALRIALDLLAAVAALHRTTAELGDEAVPLYGGLSADSVLLTSAGRTLVLDVAVTSAASTIETLGGNPERVAYAAPEQLRSPPSADARSDLFTVGVLLWELLACRRLFVGSDKAVAQKVLSSKIPRPDELRRKGDPEIPAPFIAAIMKALERDPGARPATPEELGALLEGAGVLPAEHAEVATYVTTLAEGAIQRARDALRLPSSGTRAAVQAAAAKPAETAPVAVRPAEPVAVKPALPTRAEAKPTVPARVDPRPTTPARVEPKPALPTRAEAKPTMPARAEPRPQIRARQPTMIGIPAPAILPSTQAIATPAPPPESPAPGAAVDASHAVAPAPSPATSAREIRTDSSDEEPTAQFTSRDLLKQVEQMARMTEPAKALSAGSSAPPASRTSEDFPEPSTVPNLGETARLDAPIDGGWLDDPASLPPPPPVDREAVTPDDPRETALTEEPRREPAHAQPRPDLAEPSHAEPPGDAEPHRMRVEPRSELASPRVPDFAPSSEAQTARTPERPVVSRFPGPLSIPPSSMSQAPAYLPSQMPPPLIHDPRARGAQARRPGGPPGPPAHAQGLSRSTLIGVALSVGLVIVSAAVAIIVLRGQREEEPDSHSTTSLVAPVAPGMPAAVTPAPPPEPSAVAAPVASAPAAAPSEGAAPAPSPPEKAPAAIPAPAPSPAAGAAHTPAPAPRPPTPAARHAAPKKKGRYVPDDI